MPERADQFQPVVRRESLCFGKECGVNHAPIVLWCSRERSRAKRKSAHRTPRAQCPSTRPFDAPPWAELTKLAKLRPTRDDGNTILRERFWDEDLLQLGTSAPALLDYAEMVASGDPRQREVADELRDRETNLT